MTTFASLGLAEPILRAVSEQGYTNPTPIQAEVIPAMLAGEDVLGIAQTGTGKTAAFVLPLLHKLATDRKLAGAPRMPKSCKALILAPTRELAGQILESVREYGKHLRLTACLVVGGASPGPQIRALSQGVDIVVATPGRLLDHLQAKAARLDQTQTIVLDEADQMMDLGFMPAIKDLLSRLPKERQTLLLSATMPREIRSLADQFLSSPREVAVAAESRPIERIEQKLVMVDAGKKPEALIDLLADQAIDQAIVFTRTKHGADRVQKLVRDYGHFSMAIHGNKTQGQRDKALAAFRAGKVKVLIATDVAARGIDVDAVSHVFNYDLPNVPEAYVHRIGRTGRAGRSGIAVSLCDSSEIGLAVQIERLTGCKLLPEGMRPRPGQRPGRAGPRKPGGATHGRPQGAKPSSGYAPRPAGHAPRPAGHAPRPAAADGAARPSGSANGKPAGGGRPFGKPPAAAGQARRADDRSAGGKGYPAKRPSTSTNRPRPAAKSGA